MLYIDVTRLYNNQRLGKVATGVDRVGLAYIENFMDQSCAMIRTPKDWLFFNELDSNKIFNAILEDLPIKLPKKWLRLWYKKPLPNSFLLNTSHSGLENPKYLEQLDKFNLKSIYFLHDLIPIEHPEYCRVGEYDKHTQRLLTMSKAELVITNSNDVKNKFEQYCQKQQLNCPKTIYAHLGIDDIFKKGNASKPNDEFRKLLDNQPFFLMIGTIEGRKNHQLMLMVWRSLIEKFGQSCPKLVIVGKRGWEAEQVFASLDRSLQLKSYVLELNDCSDQQMVLLLKKTQALLFPSHAEGFGLPLVEALKLKVPVITSDIQIFREIGFGVIELLNPNHSEQWQQMIINYLSDDRRNEQIKKIEQIEDKLPTWQRHFDIVYPEMIKILSLNYSNGEF